MDPSICIYKINIADGFRINFDKEIPFELRL